VAVLGLAIATAGTVRGQCPSLAGSEDFGRYNQPPKDVAVEGSYAYTADLYGLTIYAVDDPALPLKVGELLLPNAGEAITISGTTAYVATGRGGFQIIDVAQPSKPVLLGSCTSCGQAMDIAVSGNVAYVADYFSTLHIIDVADPTDLALLGTVDLPRYAKAVVVSGHLAYVAVDSAGLQIVDVEDPSQPVLLGNYDTPGTASGVFVTGNTAYVADYTSGLQIIDVTNPSAPTLLGSYDTPNFAINVTVTKAIAYTSDWSSLQIVDVSDPRHPAGGTAYGTLGLTSVAVSGHVAYLAEATAGMLESLEISDLSHPAPLGRYEAGGSAVDLAISGSIAYVANSGHGLQLVDLDDPSKPVMLGSLPSANSASDIAVAGKTAYMADSWGGLKIVDISDPWKPTLLGTYATAKEVTGIAVAGGLVYLSLNSAALAVLDVSDPSHPLSLGGIDLPGYAYDVAVSGDVAYVASWSNGVHTVDVSDPAHPKLVATYETSGEVLSVTVSGDVAYAAVRTHGLEMIDVSDPAHPYSLGIQDTPGLALDVVVSGGVAFVADYSSGLQLVDVTDPTNPALLSRMPVRRGALAAALDPATGTVWVAAQPLLEGADLRCLFCNGLQMTASPEAIETGGQTSTITVSAVDAVGGPLAGAVVTGAASLGSLSPFTDNGDGTHTATLRPGGTPGWAEIEIWLDGMPCFVRGAVHVGFADDPSIDGQLPPNVAVIPGSAHVSGAHGTEWRSDAVLHNPGRREASVALFFLKGNRDNTGVTGSVTSIPAGASSALDDIVRTTFGRTSSSGAILVASDERLVITSRTFNDTPHGTFGQLVPGLATSGSIGVNETRRLMQLTRNDHFRTNIGLANVTASALHVTVDLYRSNGSRIAVHEYSVPPFGFHQETGIIGTEVEDAFALVSSDSQGASFFTYASVVDNGSGDPTLILPVEAEGGPVMVPAAAHLRGTGGTNWRTDLEIHNPGTASVSFKVEMLPRDQANSSPPSASFEIDPGQSLRFADVLGEVFSFSGAAALRVTPANGALMVTSRTFNDVSSGTYGQFIPAEPPEIAAHTARGGRLVQLSESGVNGEGFRTNIGLSNATARDTDVEITLYDGDGRRLGTQKHTLRPFELIQIDRIFRKVGGAPVENGYAVVSSTTTDAAFHAYASVVDNLTGDPVNIPALR